MKTSTKTTTIITTPIISATKQLQKYATKDALNKAADDQWGIIILLKWLDYKIQN